MDLRGIARRQAGVFTRAQARQAGLTDRQISLRIRAGRWRSIHRGVLVDSSTPDSPLLRLWATVLAAGPGATISHTSAAALWQWEVPDLGIHVTVAPRRRPRVSPAVSVRRIGLSRTDRVLIGNLPVTSRIRTLADCAALLPEERMSQLIDRAVQQGWLGPPVLTALTRRQRGRYGNSLLRQLAPGLASNAHSTAERTLHGILRSAGITGWQANYRLRLDAARHAVVDVAFPRLKLALEVDGRAFHTNPERFRSDRSKQNALVGLGWTVLRFTWDDPHSRPGYVVASIRAQLLDG